MALLPILALLLLRIAAFVPLASAFPLGAATTGIETRFTETAFPGTGSERFQETSYNIGLQQLAPKVGVFSTSFSWAEEPGFHRLGSFFTQLQGVQVRDHVLDVILGDTFIATSLLEEDRARGLLQPLFFPTLFPVVTVPFPLVKAEERFSNFFPASLPFEGARFDLSSARSQYLFFGGRVSQLRGFRGTVADVTNEAIVGARARYRLWDRLMLGASVMRTSDSVPLSDGSIIKEDIPLTFNGQFRVTPSLLLQGEYGLSLHTLERPSGEEEGSDFYWIAGPVYRSEKLSFDFNYQRIGPQYQLFKRFAQADREGTFLSGSYRPWSFLSFSGTFDRSRNNLDDDPKLLTIDATRGLLTTTLLFPTRTFLFLRGEVTDRESREKQAAGALDTLTTAIQVDVSQPFSLYRGLFRYRRDFTDDRLFGQDSANETFRGELTGSFRNFNFLAAQEVLRRLDASGDETERTYSSLASLGYHFSPSLDLFAQFSWNHIQNRQARTTEDRYNLDSRLSYRLPLGFLLQVEFRYTAGRDSHTTQLTFQLVKRLEYGQAPPAAQIPTAVGRPAVPPFGIIEGFVLAEPGKQGVPDIKIILDEGVVALTDAQGHYSFSDVLEGEHTVRLDERKLPATFDLVGDFEQKATVQPKGRSRLDFLLAPLGRIKGRVIEDANRNGQVDPDERGMPDVRVFAVKEGERVAAFTDLDGEFLFENLKGGEYAIQVDEAAVPEGATILPAPSVKAVLDPGGEVKDLLFLIQIQPRPVIRKVF